MDIFEMMKSAALAKMLMDRPANKRAVDAIKAWMEQPETIKIIDDDPVLNELITGATICGMVTGAEFAGAVLAGGMAAAYRAGVENGKKEYKAELEESIDRQFNLDLEQGEQSVRSPNEHREQ